MTRPLRILVGVLLLPLPGIASTSDSLIYQCPGPSNTILYTDIAQSDCRSMTLGDLTIAPTRTYSTSLDSPNYTPLRSVPPDRFDYTAPIGSMRNRIVQGYPPQDFGDGPNQPPLGFGRGPGYSYPRITGRLGPYPQQFGPGPGYPHQNFGNGLGQSQLGLGNGTGQAPQGLGGASERHPQRFGGGPGRETSRSR